MSVPVALWYQDYVPTLDDWRDAFLGYGGLTQTNTLRAGAQGWLEDLIAHTEAIGTVVSLSPNGQAAFVGGTRTSDDPTLGYSESAFGLSGFALNDNVAVRKTSYALYLEGRRSAGVTGFTFAWESDLINFGDSIFATPFSLPSGSTVLWRAGIRDAPGGGNITAIATFIGTPTASYNHGFVFQNNCIANHPDLGKPIVMDMTRYQTLTWRNATSGAVVASVGSTSVSAVAGGGFHLIGTDAGYTLLNNSAAGWSVAGTTINGNGTVILANGLQVTDVIVAKDDVGVAGKLSFYGGMATGGIPNVANDAAAAAAGVLLTEVYVNSATGAMTVRRV